MNKPIIIEKQPPLPELVKRKIALEKELRQQGLGDYEAKLQAKLKYLPFGE